MTNETPNRPVFARFVVRILWQDQHESAQKALLADVCVVVVVLERFVLQRYYHIPI